MEDISHIQSPLQTPIVFSQALLPLCSCPHLVSEHSALLFCAGKGAWQSLEVKEQASVPNGGCPKSAPANKAVDVTARFQRAGLLKANWRGIHPAPQQFNQTQLSKTEID